MVSTPFCVATCNVTEDSTMSCVERDAPVRTVYWFGRRIFNESPIFAPLLAKLLSYCRKTVPTKFSFWCSIRKASRVTAVGVSSVLAIEQLP